MHMMPFCGPLQEGTILFRDLDNCHLYVYPALLYSQRMQKEFLYTTIDLSHVVAKESIVKPCQNVASQDSKRIVVFGFLLSL